MSTQVDEGLDTKTDLKQDENEFFLMAAAFEMDEEIPCENKQHKNLTDVHEGPGKVYVTVAHSECGYREGTVILICERFFNYLLTWKSLRPCEGCGKLVAAGQMVTEVGRR